jgi:hypothetical protein
MKAPNGCGKQDIPLKLYQVLPHGKPKLLGGEYKILPSRCAVLRWFNRYGGEGGILATVISCWTALNGVETLPPSHVLSAFTGHDYLLDKSKAILYSPFMDSNYFFFKGLAADAVALSVFRMSFLMLASNVLVGTFLISFFRPSSIGGSL